MSKGNFKKYFSVITILFVAAMVVTVGCSAESQSQANNEKAEKSNTITDMKGRNIEIPENPEKVIGVCSGVLRQIVYLDAADKVVGVEENEKREDTDYPYNLAHPEFKKLPSIGPNHGGDAELIVAQDPDVIFFEGDTKDANALQAKTNTPVVCIDYGDFYNQRETLYESWELMGRVLNKEDRAKEIIDYTEGLIEDLNSRTKDISEEQKPSVYPGAITHRGTHGIASTKQPFPPIEFVNGKNVANELNQPEVKSVTISREELIEWNPEVIFINSVSTELVKEDLEKRPEYRSIDAVKNGKVYGMLPYSSYHRNYSSILADSYYIGKILYPEQFSDIDPEEKADEIYTMFVGASVYEQMEEKCGGFNKIELDS